MTNAIALTYGPLLMRIAYRMLGDMKDAEDAVQETFLKWFERDTSHVQETKAYLVKTLRNICLNGMERGKRLRMLHEQLKWEGSLEDMLPAQWFEMDFEAEVASAYAQLKQKLNAAELNVFMLREVFSYEYADIAALHGQKVENCRKIFERAKKRLQENNAQLRKEAEHAMESFNQFKDNCMKGKYSLFA